MNEAPHPFETSTHNASPKSKAPSLPLRGNSSLQRGRTSSLTPSAITPRQKGRPPETSPFTTGAPGAVMAAYNVGEVHELRASVWSHVVPIIGAIVYGYYHFVQYFWRFFATRNGRTPSKEILFFSLALGSYGIYSVAKALHSRWAASRSLLRADVSGVTLHDEKRRVFVAWDQIDHFTEGVADKANPHQKTQGVVFSLRDAADNVVLEWPRSWPTTFASPKNAEAFHQYLRARVPNRRLEMADLGAVGVTPIMDELRAGETLKVSLSALLDKRKLLTVLGFIALIIGCWNIKPEMGVCALILGTTFLIWHASLPYFIEMDANTIAITHGSRRQVMAWNDLVKFSLTKGALFGGLVLDGRGEQRLVLPSFSVWRGPDRLRAYRIMLATMRRRVLSGEADFTFRR